MISLFQINPDRLSRDGRDWCESTPTSRGVMKGARSGRYPHWYEFEAGQIDPPGSPPLLTVAV